MGKDYYKILEIPRDSTGDQIKKAYRKQALRWHPDKNADNRAAAEEKFKDVAEAYDVLSDDQKRAVYDQYGEEGLKGAGPQPPPPSGGPAPPGGFNYRFAGDPRDIFSQFFKSSFNRSESFGDRGGFDDDMFKEMFGARPGGGVSSSVGQKRPVTFELNLSLEELYKGCTKRLKIKRASRSVQREAEKILEIPVTAGWKSGTKITFESEGDEIGNSGRFQDVVFVVREKRHPLFARDGSNLIHRATIPRRDALTGFMFEIPTLDGRTIRQRIEGVVKPDSSRIIPGEGMPISKQPGRRGDLIVTFDVIFPTTLSESQKESIRRIL